MFFDCHIFAVGIFATLFMARLLWLKRFHPFGLSDSTLYNSPLIGIDSVYQGFDTIRLDACRRSRLFSRVVQLDTLVDRLATLEMTLDTLRAQQADRSRAVDAVLREMQTINENMDRQMEVSPSGQYKRRRKKERDICRL